MTALEKTIDSPLSFIEKALSNPNTSMETLEKLLDFQERVMTKQAEIEFNQSLSHMQPEFPQIEKTKSAHNNIKYAPYEKIMEAIAPKLGEFGFSLSFDVKSEANTITITGTLAHRMGHSKSVSLPLMLDKSGNKQDIHAMGSTLSYGRRYVVGMLLNIVSQDEDDDGARANSKSNITDEQEKIIEEWIDKTNSNKEAFKKAYNIQNLSDLPSKKFNGVIATFKKKQDDAAK